MVVVLTAAIIGLPAIWLIRNQMDRQAWSQVSQGSQAAQALYQAQQREIEGFAMLTSQRPTLVDLLSQENWKNMEEYLQNLQASANLDLIAVCDANEIAAISQKTLTRTICKDLSTEGFHYFNYDNAFQIWLTASHPLGENGLDNYQVVVGLKLDNDFALEMKKQTGLEHTLWINEYPVVTSLSSEIAFQSNIERNPAPSQNPETETYSTFKLGDQHYYTTRLFLDDEETIQAEIALDIAEITETQNRLIEVFFRSILIIATTVSFLGIVVARRISLPLVRLADTATRFSHGDLDSPVVVDAHVSEVKRVAHALEHARVDLRATLTSLQSERDWSDDLLASIVEGIVTLDGKGYITFFSQGAERITGWSKTEVIGHSIDDIFQLAATKQPFSSILPVLPDKRKTADVLLANNKIASLAITETKLARSSGEETEIALVFRDISEEEAVQRLLGQFLASVAHEFRTPLSALEASIELLLDQAPELKPDELHELHTSLHLSILGLHTLVNNLLESANIEARRFRISPRTSDLEEIIPEAVRIMQPLLLKYGQRLVVEFPFNIPVVHADPRRTVQVLTNLLSNASRYGPPDKEIVLQVTSSLQYVRIAIIDQGPGIPPEHRDSLFHRFIFPHADDAVSQAGAGLGLSVVKAIVEAHNGQVGMDNRAGGGSIFWFTLPVAKETI